MSGIIFAHKESKAKGRKLIEKIKAGEKVTNANRFKVIKNILACSSRDWSTDDELWLIYQIALNDKGD